MCDVASSTPNDPSYATLSVVVNMASQSVQRRRRHTLLVRFCRREFVTFVLLEQYTQTMSIY